MRNFDFSPLYRATVGFDRMADLMDRALAAETVQPLTRPIISRNLAIMLPDFDRRGGLLCR